MNSLFVHVKAVVEHGGLYLILKRWNDDKVVDPYTWEFIDTELEPGESPEQAALRALSDNTGIRGEVVDTLYTWTNMLGERQCVGIAFLVHADETADIQPGEEYCDHQWIALEDFDQYIENRYVIKDLKRTLLYAKKAGMI